MTLKEKKEWQDFLLDIMVRQNQSDKKEISPLIFEVKGKLTRLDEKMEEQLEEHKKTNEHLAIINGRIGKNETKIAILEERGGPIGKIVWGVIGGIGVLIIGYISSKLR